MICCFHRLAKIAGILYLVAESCMRITEYLDILIWINKSEIFHNDLNHANHIAWLIWSDNTNNYDKNYSTDYYYEVYGDLITGISTFSYASFHPSLFIAFILIKLNIWWLCFSEEWIPRMHFWKTNRKSQTATNGNFKKALNLRTNICRTYQRYSISLSSFFFFF